MNLFSKSAKKFTEHYNDYYPLVFHGIKSKIHDVDTTEDLSQEVFTRFYSKIDEIENPKQWILGTMKMVLFEYYKKKKTDSVDIDTLLENPGLHFVNGFRDTRIIIETALSAPENFRDENDKSIYDLVGLKNYTYAEAAEHMGLTERHVRYRYNIVVSNITDYLRKKGIKNLEDLL